MVKKRCSLCVPLEHPECHPAADIKQSNNRVLTSRHKQLTVRPEPATVRSVLEPGKGLNRFLGE